ncbi:MAG: HNH endonuclease [uncultured Sulfurovum sp.]|uniref:HNH endonuclease n=1 Tax=uncultured Sulfurovum sp. TaxID=269237 RepID=A0A6S6U8T6_9BACT|nr:MAG: HNH endonuclease [uncultured Sulfurovum sp.]
MTKKERFMHVLKTFETPVTVSTWAGRVVEQYPSILNQINSTTNEPMTLRSLAASMSLKVSKGEFSEIKILELRPYRQVMYIPENKKDDLLKKELHKDIESILVEEKIVEDKKKSTESDRYRLEELENITAQLNRYFSLNFVLHHAYSLTRGTKCGKHHANNLQLLTQEHSNIKKDGEKKFSIDEQKAYLKRIISVHMMIDKSIDINLTDEVLEMLLDRLEKVY